MFRGDFAPMCRICGKMMPFSYGPNGICDECRKKMEPKYNKENNEFCNKYGFIDPLKIWEDKSEL